MKELKFLGVGSGFNTALGSTAAYFIEDKTLFLIDCGESAYARINELGLLKDIDCINFLCTHTHSDHIGSAGNLLLDCKWRSYITFNLICPTDADHFTDIVNILNGFGGRNAYSVIDPALLDHTYKSFTSVRYKPTRHGECKAAYSLVFYTDEGAVFYSGDSETMGFAEELIMGGAKIKQMYFDVSSNANSDAHLPLPNLYRLMPEQFRTRTTCMHFDSDKAIVMAKSMGFNVAVAERGEYE